MIYRVTLNRRKLLGPNNTVVSANTTTWTSGSTLDGQWTNSNTYPTKLKPNNYPEPINKKTVNNTVDFNQNLYNKNLTIPLNIQFDPFDYSDLINAWVDEETEKAINEIVDGENIKYNSTSENGFKIRFKFLNKTTNIYSDKYENAGFNVSDFKLNNFKKSYFRLYFYDSNNSETSNLLFVEDISVEPSDKVIFDFDEIYWKKEDELMKNTTEDRIVYMDAKFFNAKLGKVQSFYNPPETTNNPISIKEYSKPINHTWRTVPIRIINPNNYNGEYRFEFMGLGSSKTITLTEFILT